MPTMPDHEADRSQSGDLRPFTNREQLIEAFEKAVSDTSSDEYKILVYYGPPGIGKTGLREHLGYLLDKEFPEIAWASLDFASSEYRNVEIALSRLSEDLGREYGVRFLSYQLARVQHWQKTHPLTPPPERHNMPFLEEGTLLADLLTTAKDIPFIDIAAKITKLATKTHGWIEDWYVRRGQQELRQLPMMEPNVIEEHLPVFWAKDLKDHMRHKAPERFMQREPLPCRLVHRQLRGVVGATTSANRRKILPPRPVGAEVVGELARRRMDHNRTGKAALGGTRTNLERTPRAAPNQGTRQNRLQGILGRLWGKGEGYTTNYRGRQRGSTLLLECGRRPLFREDQSE
jgi:hypothetical protein